MQEMTWQGFFLRLLGVLVVAIAVYIFTSMIGSHFEIGNVTGYWLAVILITGITASILAFFLPEGALRYYLIWTMVIFVSLVALRATAVAYSPTAVDSMDRGQSGMWLAIGKFMNPDYLFNDSVNHTYNKQCDEIVSEKRAKEEQKALDDYDKDPDNDGQALARYNKARMDISQKYQSVVQCKKDFLGMPPQADTKPYTYYYPETKPSAPKPAPKKRPVVRRRIPHCPIICRG